MRCAVVSLTVALLVLSGCVTPRSTSTVTTGRALNGYRFVSVGDIQYANGANDQYGIKSYIETLLRQEGLEVLDQTGVQRLNPQQANAFLYCSVQHRHTSDGMGGSYATLTVDMFDALQNRIYHGEGVFQGLTVQADLQGAARKAMQGFTDSYTGYDPAATPDLLAEARAQFDDWPRIQRDRGELESYFVNRATDPIEGIWTAEEGIYQIAVFRNEENNRDFVATVLRSDHPLWREGDIKMELENTAYDDAYTAAYYMGDHSRQRTNVVLGDGGLLMEFEITNPETTKTEAVRFIRSFPPADGAVAARPGPSASGRSESSGSGFLIDEAGLVVTNHHVIAGGAEIRVIFPETGQEFRAEPLAVDDDNDLAVLRLRDFNYGSLFDESIPFSIARSSRVRSGQDVFTVGYPLGSVLGAQPRVSSGIVNSLYGLEDDPRLFQISAPIQPGNSGGPLLNSDGQLIGVVVATLNAGYFYERANIIPQNVNFAVKSDYLIPLLPDGAIRNNATLQQQTRERQVESVAPFVVSIRVR